MKHPSYTPRGIIATAVIVSGFCAIPHTWAQTAPTPASTQPEAEETVMLSPFSVTATPNDAPYQAPDSIAGSRIRVNIFDSSTGISVIPKELLTDIGSTDVLGAANYMAGVSPNNTQMIDRLSIRGFQSQGYIIDGFLNSTPTKMDPTIVDRMELVKGPNAIVSPAGVPGGSLTLTTKIAQYRNFGTANVDFGQYNTGGGALDYNHAFSNRSAARIVIGYQNFTQGKNMGYRESIALLPSVSFRLWKTSELQVQYRYEQVTHLNYIGWPIDPSATTLTRRPQLLAGLNPYTTPMANNINDMSYANYISRHTLRLKFTTNITDALSLRVSGRINSGWQYNDQWNFLNSTTQGATDPLTGNYAVGYTFGPAPTYTPKATVPPSPLYNFSQAPSSSFGRSYTTQVDLAHVYKSEVVTSDFVGGFAGEVNNTKSEAYQYSVTNQPVNIFNLSTVNYVRLPAIYSKTQGPSNFGQVYVFESLKFFKDSLIINAGVSKYWYWAKTDDKVKNAVWTSHPQPIFKNYGLVYHPLPWASIYYGHSESGSQLNGQPPATGLNPDLQKGIQDEAGVRLKFLGDRGMLSAGYFQIKQNNNSVINPALYSIPPPVVTPPPLYMDRVDRGWEIELNMALNKNLSMVGSYTNFKNRNPLGIPFRGTAENSAAVFTNYKFNEGSLKGLSLGIGYTHLGRRPGDTVTGATAASTTAKLIPVQPTFYLPAYGLVNLTGAYTINKNWTVRGFIDNALDAFYLQGSLNRNAVLVGIPRNFRGTIVYSF